MIIAEASLQHDGYVGRAMDTASAAQIEGADAIKFQIFVPDEPLFCPLEGDGKRWPKWMKSTMPESDWRKVKKFCDEIGIIFMASVFQHAAVDLYRSLNPKWWKVASRAAATFPYEKAGGPFIVSAGGQGQISHDVLLDQKNRILQCCMEYPHKLKQWAIRDDPRVRQITCGLSDHSGSSWPSIDALARGAQIIEVHVDFGREQKLPEEITLDQLNLICEARDAFAAMRKS